MMFSVASAWALIAQAVPVDPVSTFAPLGVAGLICVTLILWQRDTKSERDRAMKGLEDVTPTLTRVLDVLESSNEAHANAAAAQQAAAEALRRVPSEETFTRIKVALEQAEQRQREARER